MRINGDRVTVPRPRHLVAVQVLPVAGSPEAWRSLLHHTRNRREAIRDGDQDSGPVLPWVASPITSLTIAHRLSRSRHRLRTIGNEYLGRRFSGIDGHLLPRGMKIAGRAHLTLARRGEAQGWGVRMYDEVSVYDCSLKKNLIFHKLSLFILLNRCYVYYIYM